MENGCLVSDFQKICFCGGYYGTKKTTYSIFCYFLRFFKILGIKQVFERIIY
jgi:hypothetical protein